MVPILLEGVKRGLYELEEDGRVWSNYKHDYLSPSKDKNGYLHIHLSGGDRCHRKDFRIGNLVALVFIGPPPKEIVDPTINHIDGNILNNNVSNLEWIERGINSSIRKNKGAGNSNHEAKLTELQVYEICDLLINTNLSYSDICNKYNIGKSTISSIKNQRSWKHITKNYDFSCRINIRNEKGQFQNINTKFLKVDKEVGEWRE